jgi:hypothetical protein
MRYTKWINMGRDMALVDERGAIRGVLITLDDQIGHKIRRAFYEPPRMSERHAFDKDNISEMKIKENERNAV